MVVGTRLDVMMYVHCLSCSFRVLNFMFPARIPNFSAGSAPYRSISRPALRSQLNKVHWVLYFFFPQRLQKLLEFRFIRGTILEGQQFFRSSYFM